MPIYEYECIACGNRYSEVRSITDYCDNGPRRSCPNCKARKLERRVNGTSFVLDGNGWPSKDIRQGR